MNVRIRLLNVIKGQKTSTLFIFSFFFIKKIKSFNIKHNNMTFFFSFLCTYFFFFKNYNIGNVQVALSCCIAKEIPWKRKTWWPYCQGYKLQIRPSTSLNNVFHFDIPRTICFVLHM